MDKATMVTQRKSQSTVVINYILGILLATYRRPMGSLGWLLGSPDALVQGAELSHQFCGSFILIATQVMDRLNGLGGGFKLVLVDVHSLVLWMDEKRDTVIWMFLLEEKTHKNMHHLIKIFSHTGKKLKHTGKKQKHFEFCTNI